MLLRSLRVPARQTARCFSATPAARQNVPEPNSAVAQVFSVIPSPTQAGWKEQVNTAELSSAMENYYRELRLVERFESKMQDARSSPYYLEVEKFIATPAAALTPEVFANDFPVLSKNVFQEEFTSERFSEALGDTLDVPAVLRKRFGEVLTGKGVTEDKLSEQESPENVVRRYINKYEDDLQDALDAIEWDYASGKNTTSLEAFEFLDHNPTPANLWEIEKQQFSEEDRNYNTIIEEALARSKEDRAALGNLSNQDSSSSEEQKKH